ncbi:MAG TPA: cell division protein FtsZ [Chloroflexota bacterium]|nr:cell division protein FtsZ [Chloroflexota bacterium]
MPDGRQRGGFNPDRLADLSRTVSVVPQIVEPPRESQARGFTEVKIVGVGGGGSNAVNRMVETGVQGVEFIAVNTDAQALQMSSAMRKIPIGGRSAKGLGAGGDPEQGERAAEISRDALTDALEGADMVFLTASLGGGTGTGATPVIADMARRARALTVAVVTLPFGFEGFQRRRAAEEGLARLRGNVDALIVIPNDRLLELGDRQMSMLDAFSIADDVLRHGVQGISDLVTMTGLINLDFADVKAVMQNAGTALMAVGEARGDDRAIAAARAAISSPLLDVSIDGATGVLLNVSGGPDLTLAEVTEAAETIQAAVDPDASIFFGAVVHPRQQDEIRVTVIATGLKDRGMASSVLRRAPAPQSPPREAAATPTRYAAPPAATPAATPPPQRAAPPSPREAQFEPPPRPGSTEWERDRSSEKPRPPAPEVPDDDWDVPAFLRRPKRY